MQINVYNNMAASAFSAAQKGIETGKNTALTDARRAAALDTNFGVLLEKALIEPDGRDAVAAAKRALADGSLQSEQAFSDAAETMLNMGI